MSRAKRVGTDIADKYLGHEENILMGVEDARYRYYQWLRDWYGLNEAEATHKCPFYQFMFWGSIWLLATLIPFFLLKVVELVILKPLSLISPASVDDIYESISRSKMMASWVTTCIIFVLAAIIGGIFSTDILPWVGAVIHWIFAAPMVLILLLGIGFGWLFTEAVPWLFDGIVLVLAWVADLIWAVIIGIIGLPWTSLGIFLLWALVWVVAFCVGVYICYKLALLLFNSSFSAWIIKKSCVVREAQIVRKKARKERIKKARQDKAEARYQWEQGHNEEVERQRKLKYAKKLAKVDSKALWKEFFSGTGSKLWKFLRIFPGSVFYAIWLILKYLGLGFFHVGCGFGFVFEKIGDFFVIGWSIFTKTLSNHCPPIDFVIEVSDTGRLTKRNHVHYTFKCDNSNKVIDIPISKFPVTFMPSAAKSSKAGSIVCTIGTQDLLQYKRMRNMYGDSSPEIVLDVYGVQELKYAPPKPRKKKVI